MNLEKIPKGECIYGEGDPIEKMYIILRGSVNICCKKKDKYGQIYSQSLK